MSDIYVGIDLGGTRIKCGLVQSAGVLASRVIPAESGRGLAPALDSVRQAIHSLCREVGASLSDCRGVGWGFPALVDHERVRVRNTYAKYDDATECDFAAWTLEHLGLPAAIENDARLALIGEWQHGALRGCRNCAIVTIGTGIGTAVVLDGKPLRGRSGAAGNLGGHLMASVGGRPCSCGRNGCYESEAGSKSLPGVAQSLPEFSASALARAATIDYEAAYRLASQGDSCATTIRDRAQRYWAELCVDLAQTFDLERIAMAGGVMRHAETILPVLRDRIRTSNTFGQRVEITVAQDVDQMALRGVPWLVQERRSEDDR